jgi:hypothetical protein
MKLKKLVSSLQRKNPYILTSLDGRPVFMHKTNPIYKPKKNDRIVSVDCVLANEDRLIEVTKELGLPKHLGVFELDA